jgi:magnesium-transporting ATPase (P-type)
MVLSIGIWLIYLFKATIEKCQYYGVPVRMITGDNILIAKKTCKDLDMGNKSSANWPNIQVRRRDCDKLIILLFSTVQRYNDLVYG